MGLEYRNHAKAAVAVATAKTTVRQRLTFLYREVFPDALAIPPLEVKIRA